MQEFVDAVPHPLLGPAADAEAEGDVLEHRHVPEQGVMLEDEADVPLPHGLFGDVLGVVVDRPRVRDFEAGDDPQERGLARSRGPEQGHERAPGRFDGHVVEGREGAEPLADIPGDDTHRTIRLRPVAVSDTGPVR